jgi:signal transduction histidine kinase/ActR/RegA family two-component response regulator
MDSLNDQREFFLSSLLSLQRTVSQVYRDEKRLVEFFMEEVFRLTGAHFLILKKSSERESSVLASRCFDGTPCDEKSVLEHLDLLSGDFKKKYTDEEHRSWFIDFDPPFSLSESHEPLQRILVVHSSLFSSISLEMILLNVTCQGEYKELTQQIKGFLHPVCEAMEKAALEDKINRKERQLTQALDSKTQFLGSLSHEIRSPLNGIICMGSLLRETALDEEQLDLLNIIHFSADNITRIIQDLVDLTLLISGQVILKNETFSLSTLCHNLIKNMKEEADRKGLDLGFHIHEGVDSFHGDSVRIGQILSNLIQNAIKYTRQGEIFLDVRRSGTSMEFVVSDTGVGIPRDKQEFIFEEFTQLGNSVHKDRVRGVGLGLAIVKDLIEMMGGMVTVKSREGKGSSFTVFLPDSEVEESKVPDEKPTEHLSSPWDASFLIVDDDEINRLYLKMFLEGLGAHIDEAENGRIAVEKAAGNKYDMILMDISMPVMNGLDATKEIRKIKKDLPVLAVTANAFEEDFKRILEAGLNDIVLKPVDEKQLIEKISNWLRRNRSND